MSPLKAQQTIWTQLSAAHPVLLMQHLGIKTPEQLDQTSGRHHHIWGWQCTKRIISPDDFNMRLKSDEIKQDCHSLLSLWVLYWARSCSKSSLMASGQRPATSLMALILEDKKAFKIHQWLIDFSFLEKEQLLLTPQSWPLRSFCLSQSCWRWSWWQVQWSAGWKKHRNAVMKVKLCPI